MECKYERGIYETGGKKELIDTLWNVNICRQQSCSGALRINRYIMECKCSSPKIYAMVSAELIDTLWNVNGKQVTKGRMLDFRINRYIMECKR